MLLKIGHFLDCFLLHDATDNVDPLLGEAEVPELSHKFVRLFLNHEPIICISFGISENYELFLTFNFKVCFQLQTKQLDWVKDFLKLSRVFDSRNDIKLAFNSGIYKKDGGC